MAQDPTKVTAEGEAAETTRSPQLEFNDVQISCLDFLDEKRKMKKIFTLYRPTQGDFAVWGEKYIQNAILNCHQMHCVLYDKRYSENTRMESLKQVTITLGQFYYRLSHDAPSRYDTVIAEQQRKESPLLDAMVGALEFILPPKNGKYYTLNDYSRLKYAYMDTFKSFGK